jgi:hypothetical protein
MISYGYSAVLLSIWALGELSRIGGVNRIYGFIVTVGVAASYLITVEETAIKSMIQLGFYLALILGLALLNMLLLYGKRRAFVTLMAGLTVLAGVTVNPINIGAGAIYNNTISKEIEQIQKTDKNAVWMADDGEVDGSGALGILIYANGAHSVGGINNYPDYAKWSAIDPQGKYSYIYNRSAHISFQIVNVSTSFTLIGQTCAEVNINQDDLKKLSIKYVISKNNLQTFDDSTVNFKPLFAPDADNYSIYQVTYS